MEAPARNQGKQTTEGRRQSLIGDSDMWMSSTQFVQMLDKQEAEENRQTEELNFKNSMKAVTRNMADKNFVRNDNEDNGYLKDSGGGGSVLEENSVIPMSKMKQVRRP